MTEQRPGAAAPGPMDGMPGTQTVLVAGATGMLGSKVAAELLRLPGIAVRLLARPETRSDPRKRAVLDPLVSAGAKIIPGRLADLPSLITATAGVDVVVSAVQGGKDVIVEGQAALAGAAADNGVRRMLPSDFALDLFKAPPGEHYFFDLRREADAMIAGYPMEQVNVLGGAFMDGFVNTFFDHDARTVTYWGDGTERFDATTTDDTARYTARAAVDTALPAGKFAVAAEQLSFAAMTEAVQDVTGHRYTRHSLGTVDDLRGAIANTRSRDSDPAAPVMLAYMLFMLTGQTALENLQNNRYPEITPESFHATAARLLGTRNPS